MRDINTASRLIGDMRGDTLDDPLSDRYNKLGCKMSVVDKESDDYKMIVKYLETTYEPVKVSDVVSSVSWHCTLQTFQMIITTMIFVFWCYFRSMVCQWRMSLRLSRKQFLH